DSEEEGLFSSEEALDSDRPDYYKKPLEPTPNDDFTNSGLPDWMDPIYDEADPSEYFRLVLRMRRDGDGKADVDPAEHFRANEGLERSSDREAAEALRGLDDIHRIAVDDDGEIVCEMKRAPGVIMDEDLRKTLTASEESDLERIWEDASDDDNPFLNPRFLFARDPRDPHLLGAAQPATALQAVPPGGLGDAMEEWGGGDKDEEDEDDPMAGWPYKPGKFVKGRHLFEHQVPEERFREWAIQTGGLDHDQIPSEYMPTKEYPLVWLKDKPDGSVEVLRAAHPADPTRKGDVTAAEVLQDACLDFLPPPPGFNATEIDQIAKMEVMRPFHARAFEGARKTVVEGWGFEPTASPWRFSPRAWKDMVEEWGFEPTPWSRVPGFNTWNTTLPAPLSPPPAPESGDIIVPDRRRSIPAALVAAPDGAKGTTPGTAHS
ncbi:hypothetical protein T484DRAFT_1852732, partial [Baffinella frigidus]